MISYNATILKFEKQGEKTGWTYIEIQADVAHQLKPNTKTSFRVKGKLDNYSIKAVALLPMGNIGWYFNVCPSGFLTLLFKF